MIAVYGCGELFYQIVALGLDKRLKACHLIDSNPAREGELFAGEYVICTPVVLETYTDNDTVCMMSGEHEAQILRTIRSINPDVRVIPYGHVISWMQGCAVGQFEEITEIETSIESLQKMTWKMRADRVSYSQNAEDLVFEHMCTKEKGLYVDVGAHHPMLYSNTYRLYLKGWNGINIDPLPDCKELFDLYRPDDINLNVGIGLSHGNQKTLQYYRFEHPTFNTMNKARVDEIQRAGWTKLLDIEHVPIVTLSSVFDEYVGDGMIDLLTVDVESMEMQVLETNNWDLYRPRFIIVEALGSYVSTLMELYDIELVKYVRSLDYEPINKVAHAVFFGNKRTE